MFLAGAYIAVNYPPLAQYLGSREITVTDVRTVPTTITNRITITTTYLDTYTYTAISREFITTTLSQVSTSVREVTKTVTTTVSAGGTTTITSPTTPTIATATTAKLVNPFIIYFTDRFKVPGLIYVYNYRDLALGTFLDVRLGAIGCFTFHPAIAEKVYYVDPSYREIRLYDLGAGERIQVFYHTTYIRCVRFGPENKLYFSEATGGGADGKIYKIVSDEAQLYYEVKLRDVGDFWAGHFEFDDEGKLYLSSGNIIPASLYIVVSVNQAPSKIATFNFPIMGIRYVKGVVLEAEGRQVSINKGLLLTDNGSSIYLYDLDSKAMYKIYENLNFKWLSDVSFRT